MSTARGKHFYRPGKALALSTHLIVEILLHLASVMSSTESLGFKVLKGTLFKIKTRHPTTSPRSKLPIPPLEMIFQTHSFISQTVQSYTAVFGSLSQAKRMISSLSIPEPNNHSRLYCCPLRATEEGKLERAGDKPNQLYHKKVESRVLSVPGLCLFSSSHLP